MLIITFIIGTILGSFLHSLAERVPIKPPILCTFSHCTFCKSSLKWKELIPLVSFIRLQARCSYCQNELPKSLFFLELISGGLFVFFHITYGFQPFSFYLLAIGLMGMVLSMTDIFYHVVEPKLLLTFLSIILTLKVTTLGWNFFYTRQAIFVLIIFLLLSSFGDFIGGGDIKLLVVWTFLLGIHFMVQLLFFSSSCALFWSLLFLKKDEKIPFVPFLTLGFFITLWRPFFFS